MKIITLNIDDDVYNDLNSHMLIKAISGNLYGIEDGFIMKIIKYIDTDKKEVTFKYNSEDKKDT